MLIGLLRLVSREATKVKTPSGAFRIRQVRTKVRSALTENITSRLVGNHIVSMNLRWAERRPPVLVCVRLEVGHSTALRRGEQRKATYAVVKRCRALEISEEIDERGLEKEPRLCERKGTAVTADGSSQAFVKPNSDRCRQGVGPEARNVILQVALNAVTAEVIL